MLKLFISSLLLLSSLPALACIVVDGKLGIDGENYKFSQKVETMMKEYSVSMGNFIFTYSFHFPEKAGAGYNFRYKIVERKSNKLIPVSSGEEEVGKERAHEIYAKGQAGQPNSIINVKVKEI